MRGASLPCAILIAVLGIPGLALGPLACATPEDKKRGAVYGPSESVIEVVAVLRRHVSEDTYRFPPPTDFAGRNLYRATLLRIEGIERLHADALRAGHLDASLEFAKGRSLERLRAYDLAAQHYRAAARRQSALREEALRSATVCEEIDAATRIGVDLVDPLAGSGETGDFGLSLDADAVTDELDQRVGQLSELAQRAGEDFAPHYGFVLREEAERADLSRARYFRALRHLLPDGQVRAIAELQRVVSRHRPSKRYHSHVLELADLYALLAEEYVEANPPESLRFDPPSFHELVDSATRLYQSVASQDGSAEKLEAARRFEAFLAFTLQVDRDRFTR